MILTKNNERTARPEADQLLTNIHKPTIYTLSFATAKNLCILIQLFN
jgi:hypothetical protein